MTVATPKSAAALFAVETYQASWALLYMSPTPLEPASSIQPAARRDSAADPRAPTAAIEPMVRKYRAPETYRRKARTAQSAAASGATTLTISHGRFLRPKGLCPGTADQETASGGERVVFGVQNEPALAHGISAHERGKHKHATGTISPFGGRSVALRGISLAVSI